MYRTHLQNDSLSGVIASLEIPDCSCPVDLSCPCGQSCQGEAARLCVHCREECDCTPALYQPPCRHVLEVSQSPAWRAWRMETVRRWLADLGSAQTYPDFELAEIQKLLLRDDREAYEERRAPPTPLLAVSWVAHVGELARRETCERALRDKGDERVRERLRMAQIVHRQRNGAVLPGELVPERAVSCG